MLPLVLGLVIYSGSPPPPYGLAPGMLRRVGGLAAAADSDIQFEGCLEMSKRIEE